MRLFGRLPRRHQPHRRCFDVRRRRRLRIQRRSERGKPGLDLRHRSLDLVTDLEESRPDHQSLDEHLRRLVTHVVAPFQSGGQVPRVLQQLAQPRALVRGRLEPGVLLAQQDDLGIESPEPLCGLAILAEEGVRAPPERAPLARPVAVDEGDSHSTVTVFARFRGWSTSSPRRRAIRYASSCRGITASTGWSSGSVDGTDRT
jgi:hypothetical protein